MGEKFEKDLQIALLLRGLPAGYGDLVAMIKLRETLPSVEEVISRSICSKPA
jgi:hypothetical protein